MIETLKPWGRAIKYGWLQRISEYKAQHNWLGDNNNDSPPVFLIGCGRSGTTILGYILSLHPDIFYLLEPYHLWAAIEPKTDILNFYHQIDAHFLMNESHWTENSQDRFNRLFIKGFPNKKTKIVMEKTPINTVRIGYLNALAPEAKFIHIIRDGFDVACSIERLASTNQYKIANKPHLNQWWGNNNYKWKAMMRDCIAAGYFPHEIDRLSDHRSKAAYEWLVSLSEVDCWREKLGDRLCEVTYTQLTKNPESVLRNICAFLNLDMSNTWLEGAIAQVKPSKPSVPKTIVLPPAMCEAFNSYQERFGFTNRATLI
ncbi:MAG: sulfotransferase [Hydrococcus sp. RU_2_2]|nr:sulfotransferase [Hydrococcus sp. RU_2_2]